MHWWLLLIPISSALACWLIVRLLMTVLFRPYNSKSFLGLKVQGIIPAKQSSIAAQAGTLVAQKFFSPDLIKQKIGNPANLQKIMPVIEEQIDDFLRNKLKKQMPFIGAFVGEKTIASLKKVFVNELETLFPKIMNDYASNLIDDLDIQTLVSQKINAISIAEAENSFHEKFSRELALLQAVSILIGLLFGFITALTIFFIK